MTTVDFRSGGFQGARPQRYAQDFPYGQNGQAEGWQDDDWDDPRYPAGHEGAVPQPVSLWHRLSRLTHYLGALISVGLIVILLVWSYKLVVRDVSGVPVIRSLEGAARTTPAEPGGELTDRAGLAVNSVAAGVAAQVADKVAIAPEPTGLSDQDLAMGQFGATAQEPSSAVELPPLDAIAPIIPQTDSEAVAAFERLAAEAAATETAPVSTTPATEAPVNEALTDLAGRETQDTAINQALAEAAAMDAPRVETAVVQSARPLPRPRRIASVAAAAPAATSRPAAAREAAAREAAPVKEAEKPAPAVASGSAMVQIGAFDSDAIAKGEWKRVSGKFGDLFSGKSRVVQEAQSGGRTFWRLRAAGFASRDEARKFCAALIAKGVDCIPATAK